MFDDLQFLIVSVEAGSFAAAGRKLGVTPSAVSRRVAQLERELGVQLLARTTRSLRLTHDGQAFHDRCASALRELQEARESLARSRSKPSGLLRVETSSNLGRLIVAPALPSFSSTYPDVRMHLTLRDQLVDPVAEGADVLIRIGPLADSSLIARKLADCHIVRCAAPAYLREHGTPQRPEDLGEHRCLGYLADGRPRPFGFVAPDGRSEQAIHIEGPCHVNDGEAMLRLAVAGMGIVSMFDFMVQGAIERGELTPVLEDYPAPSWPIHALYLPNRHLLPRVRVFIEHMVKTFAPWPAPPRS
ncbi:MAG TPA: LysR family transcriptional regulator [Polyangiaceae bacterium]|nr:LysR family transcriptional regulator [Polyangiaceae bacterium]